MPDRRLDASALLDWADAAVAALITHADEINRLNILHASLLAMRRALEALNPIPHRALIDGNRPAIEAILIGYADGTRFGIRADDDGLLAAGEPGVQLTWMDAKVGDWVVTPRIGKPVEVQALWLNALIVTRTPDILA